MSVAGRRSGIDGARSGLYFQAVRIIKEMLEATNGEYPKYLVFENVPGMLSSNNGDDLIRALDIIEDLGFIPDPTILDAQYMGVPQRRKRVYITWVRLDHLMKRKTPLSNSVALQYLTEIQLIRLAEVSRGRELPLPKSVEQDASRTFDGLTRREKLFAPVDMQGRLNDLGIEEPCVDSCLDIDVDPCDCFGGLLKTLEFTLARDEVTQYPNCYEWVGVAIKELEEYTNARSKYCKSIEALDGCDPLWSVFQKLRACKAQFDGYFADGRGSEILPQSQSLCRDSVPGRCERQGTAAGTPSGVGASDTGHDPERIVLGDQGGSRMDLSYDVTGTLRAQANHPPCVMALEHHPHDSRIGIEPDGQVQTLSKRMGTGGGNVPLLMEETPVAFGISAQASNAMQSDNPHSGIYQAETARTLDTSNQSPSKNQGGIAIVEPVYALQGSMIGRANKNGPQGDGINEDVCFTLDTADRHCIAAPTYGIGRDVFNQGINARFAPCIAEETQPTLVAKGPGAVAKPEPLYTVRRLTPIESARLQGFEDDWCDDLGIPNPTEEDMAFWTEVFATYARVTGCKMKSEKQIRKWLADPYSDAVAYQLWGNGICVNSGLFIMNGIVMAETMTESAE